jgi:hypothetical protein
MIPAVGFRYLPAETGREIISFSKKHLQKILEYGSWNTMLVSGHWFSPKTEKI